MQRSLIGTGPLTGLALALSLAAPVSAASRADKLVIEAGRIVTLAGDDVENGVIVIENGRITALGAADEIEKPWDAPVIGGPDLVAFPGFVEAHTSNGLDRPNENIDVTPFLDVRDSVDPVAFYFEDCLRYGVTTVNLQHGSECVIGAMGRVVRPVGLTVEEMTVRPAHGNKISLAPKRGKSRATQVQTLRQTFDGLRRYLEDLVEKERDEAGYAEREALFQGRELEAEEAEGRAMGGTAWTVDGLELVPRGAIDEKLAPLLDMVEGLRPVYLQCNAPVEVGQALEVARANGFLARSVLVIAPGCWKAADLIAEAGVPVILEGELVDVRRNAVTGEEEETFVPGVLAEHGIRFAISTEDSGRHSLWYQAALAVGLGLEREQALAAVTTVPAEILGMGNEVGSLEVGKLGNVLLLTGDPLSITTWVEEVVVEGRSVYERREDVRNKHLLEGVQPRGTVGQVIEEPGGHGHDPIDTGDPSGDDEESGDEESGEDEAQDDEEEGR